MKATNKQIIVALVILVLVVIAANNLSIYYVWESAYYPQNDQERAWMQKQLEAKGIQYRIDEENHIVVTGEHIAQYKSLISKIRDERRMFSQMFGSSDKEYLNVLKKELEKAGILYRINYKGEIGYMEHDRPRFKSIVSMINNRAKEKPE